MASVPIADLTIKITDNATQAATSVNSLADALERLGGGRSPASLKTTAQRLETLANVDPSGLERLREALERMVEPAERLAGALATVNVTFARISNTADTALTQATQTAESLQSAAATMTTINAEMTSGMAGAGEATEEAGESARTFADRLESAANVVKAFHAGIKSVMPNIVSQFLRLAKMRVLRTIVKELLAGFTEGLQNVYYWAKLTGNQFAASMDTIKTSLNYTKNSIGAAFAPIINAIAPIIDQLVDKLVEGINYINMFFAVLNGQSTYIRAKKVATEYGNAVASSAGGAAAAVKDLKAALSVLDFDELHQLQDVTTPSSGGGGGGGGGKETPDYGSMFEEAEIENNWLTKTASWLKDNFDDVLDVVKAIGAAILTWKFSTAFSNALGGLWNLQERIGLTMVVGGITLVGLGAYDMGKNGVSLENILKVAFGSGIAIAGGILKWGVATGLEITLPLTLLVGTVSFALGKQKANIEAYQTSDFYKDLQDKIQKLADDQQYIVDLKAKINSLTVESDERVQNVQVARNILDELKEWDGLQITPDVDTTQLDTLISMLNSLNMDGVVGQWNNVNGVVQINIDEIQDAIDKYDEYIRHLAAQDLLIEAYKAQYQAQQKLSELQKEYAQESDNFNTMLDNYEYGADFAYGLWDVGEGDESFFQNPINWAKKLFTDVFNPEAANEQRALNDQYSYLQDLEDRMNEAAEAVGLADDAVVNLKNELGLSVDAYTDYSGAVEETVENVDGLTEAVDTATNEIPGDVSDINSTLSEIGDGVNLEQNGKKIKATLSKSLDNAGEESKKAIEGAIEKTGDSLDGFAIMTKINSRLALGQQNVPFKDRGQYIGQQIQSGAKSGFDGNDTLTSIKDKLVKAKKGISFTSTATTIGSEITSGAKTGFDASKVMNNIYSVLYKYGNNTEYQKYIGTIGAKIAGVIGYGAKSGFSGLDMYKAIMQELVDASSDPTYGEFADVLANALASAMDSAMDASGQGAAKSLFWGIYNAVDAMDFSSIGTNIAGDIKYGIANNLNNSTLEIATYTPTQVLNKTKGTVYASLYASGGFPEAGTLFLAGETGAGAEVVGTINGRTGVANSDQIASAIAMAMKPLLAGGASGTQTTNVEVKLDSATIARASMKGQRAMNQQYNLTARA